MIQMENPLMTVDTITELYIFIRLKSIIYWKEFRREMKTQIRKGVFETNSSSTHSICISKTPVNDVSGRFIEFNLGEYGFEFEEYDAADYLYTAIICQDDCDELLLKLKQILDKHNISYKMQKPTIEPCYGGFAYGRIDHDYACRDFITAVLEDEDLLFRCIFSEDSIVYTGNDEDGDRPDTNGQASNDMWDDESRNYIPNPYHDENKYDYFYKGN